MTHETDSRRAPARRKVRIAGRLERIRFSDCRFTVILATGARVDGTAKALGTDALREGFGKNVTSTGTAELKPSGRLLRVVAERLEPATESELQIFASLPCPLLGRPAPIPAKARRGLEDLLGQWPGEEPLELLLGQLHQLG
jgi:hypothetical protein